MKKIFLILSISLFATIAFSQHPGYDKIRRDYPGKYYKDIRKAKLAELDKEYRVTIGTSKLNASYDKDGIVTTDKDLRLVGLLFRGGKLVVDELYIEITKDGLVVDSSTVSCGSNAKWKDFYMHLTNVLPGENYNAIVYSSADKTTPLGNKKFYIRKE
jgi:hypothetical protein